MKVIYWGPVTPAGKPSKGGYEAANRKNIDALRSRGVEVAECPYPVVPRRFGPLGKLVYAALFLSPLRWIRYRGCKDMVLHSTPLYGTLALPALWGVRLARWLGMRVVTDVRAGSLPHYWATKSRCYRAVMRRMFALSDAVTVEGRGYVDFMRDTVGDSRQAVYFPNLADGAPVQGADVPAKPLPDALGHVNVFYFGRITRNKGIDVILDARRELPARYRFYLAGPIAPDVSRESLEVEGVEYLGQLTPDRLRGHLADMHFFIFPTRHVGEGQSNSLIEAMNAGLVPVTSCQGFCREVVGGCGVTLPSDATGADYARAIREIAEGGDFAARSQQCRRHIAANHNIDIEIPKLIKLYKCLCR